MRKIKTCVISFRLLPAAIEFLSPSQDIIRLPKAIAPFDAAVVVTKALETNVLVEYTLSTLDQGLKGGILLDDRYEFCIIFRINYIRVDQNVGKRLKELNRLGIPQVIVIGKTTEASLNSTPKMEYLTTDADSDDYQKKGVLTLTELMQEID